MAFAAGSLSARRRLEDYNGKALNTSPLLLPQSFPISAASALFTDRLTEDSK